MMYYNLENPVSSAKYAKIGENRRKICETFIPKTKKFKNYGTTSNNCASSNC